MLKTIEEFDELGRDAFLREYNFGRAIKWFILHERRFYDAKAIAGVAHKYLKSGNSHLGDKEFHTGEGSKALEKLKDLGFDLIDREARSCLDLAPKDANSEEFSPQDIKDARRTIVRAIKERRGQRKFRDSLLRAYNSRCAISLCAIVDVLESAHIYPYRGPDTNTVTNGILLRADLHTLFDCGLISIDVDTMRVRTSPRLQGSEYECYQDKLLTLPAEKGCWPSREALKMREEELRFREN